VTDSQWETLRPAFRADRRLQAECRAVLSHLPTSVRAAFVTELATQLRRARHPPQALGLAVEAAARRALARHGLRALPVLVPSNRRRRPP
jgi:hypothetical protein